MSLSVYESFSELFRKEVSFSDLLKLLSTFSRDSVLWHCAALNYGARIWESNAPSIDISLDQELGIAIRFYFPADVASTLILRMLRVDRRTPFHRRQILALQKLAIQHCGSSGITVDQAPNLFGALLLIVNDHLHPSRPLSTKERLKTPADFCALMADLVPTSEIGDERLGISLARSLTILGPIAEVHRGRSVHFDVIGEFEANTGLSFQNLRTFVFASVAYTNTLKFSQLLSDRGALHLNRYRFSQTSFSVKELSMLFDYLGSSADQVRSDTRKRDYGINDFTELRRTPLVERWWNVGTYDQWCGYLVLDPVFLFEKIQSAPYWLLNGLHGQKFRIFWGLLFEDYCNELMKQACGGSGMQYIPGPKKSRNEQVCDGVLLDGDKLILFEYKTCMVSAETKYSGDASLLQRDIERNLVRSKDGKKGVEQLADAIEHLFGAERGIEKLTDRWPSIKQVFPCIVTMDSIGGAVGLAPMLQLYARHFDFERLEIKPIFAIWIGELERKARHFGDLPPEISTS